MNNLLLHNRINLMFRSPVLSCSILLNLLKWVGTKNGWGKKWWEKMGEKLVGTKKLVGKNWGKKWWKKNWENKIEKKLEKKNSENCPQSAFLFSACCFPSHHLCPQEEGAALSWHLHGNHRRGDLGAAPGQERGVPEGRGHLHPLLWCQWGACGGWLHLRAALPPSPGTAGQEKAGFFLVFFFLNAKHFPAGRPCQEDVVKCKMESTNCILRVVHRGNKQTKLPNTETLFHMFIQFNLSSILMKANNQERGRGFELFSPYNS